MKLYVGITDFDWFSLHAAKEFVEDVNFWRPSPQANFKVLQRGEPFLFKLHALAGDKKSVPPRGSEWLRQAAQRLHHRWRLLSKIPSVAFESRLGRFR